MDPSKGPEFSPASRPDRLSLRPQGQGLGLPHLESSQGSGPAHASGREGASILCPGGEGALGGPSGSSPGTPRPAARFGMSDVSVQLVRISRATWEALGAAGFLGEYKILSLWPGLFF